jgi:hypothetical protein
MVSQRLRGAARNGLACALVVGFLCGLLNPAMMPRWVLALVVLPPLCFSMNVRCQAHDMKVPFKKLHELDSTVSARVAAELASECNGSQETIPSFLTIATAPYNEPLVVSPWDPLIAGYRARQSSSSSVRKGA